MIDLHGSSANTENLLRIRSGPANRLKETVQEKTLVETSYDETWGTGQHLGSRDCLTKSKWKSIGILGRILMRIRSEAQTASVDKANSENMDTLTPSDKEDIIPNDSSSN